MAGCPTRSGRVLGYRCWRGCCSERALSRRSSRTLPSALDQGFNGSVVGAWAAIAFVGAYALLMVIIRGGQGYRASIDPETQPSLARRSPRPRPRRPPLKRRPTPPLASCMWGSLAHNGYGTTWPPSALRLTGLSPRKARRRRPCRASLSGCRSCRPGRAAGVLTCCCSWPASPISLGSPVSPGRVRDGVRDRP